MYEVRRCRARDVPSVAGLKRAVEDATYREYGTPEEHAAGLATYCSREYVTQLMGRSEVLLAFDLIGTHLAGMVSVRRDPASVSLSALYCLESGRGTGTALLNAALTQERPGVDISVEVFEQNLAAHRFFSGLGFVPTGAVRPSNTYSGGLLIGLSAPIAIVRTHLSARLA